jgi:O-glycosyl hydrolase
MKTSGSMIGGTLNTSDYQVFANYLVKFLQAYKAAGVPVSLITPQNEPEYSASNYPARPSPPPRRPTSSPTTWGRRSRRRG